VALICEKMVDKENAHFYFEILQGERVSQDNKKEAIKPPITKSNLLIADTHGHGDAEMRSAIPCTSWYEGIHERLGRSSPQ
jgi:hypothetical protein